MRLFGMRKGGWLHIGSHPPCEKEAGSGLLLLDKHTIRLRRILLLRHVHAFLMPQLVSISEHKLFDFASQLGELVLFEDADGDGVAATGRVAELDFLTGLKPRDSCCQSDVL